MSTVTTEWTLYDIEEQLAALVESVETVTPEQEQEFLEDFKAALTSAAEKRDRIAHYLAHLEYQQECATKEIARLQKFKKEREAAQARLEGYVSYCIRALGRDQKGRYKKLEGNTTIMFLRACPASAEVTDIDAVPLEYLNVTVTMPTLMLNSVLDVLGPEFREKVLDAIAGATSYVADKRAIRGTLEAGVNMPGAKLINEKTTLVRK